MTPEIKTSTNYDQFEIILGNRNLNQKKINNIKNDIKKGLNLLPFCPIIVYQDIDKFKIVDGQHRFEVAKQLECNVYYIVAQELSLHQIAMMNIRQDKWSTRDFLKCYIKVGIEDYKVLDEIATKYKVQITTSAAFLMNGSLANRQSVETAFREGLFKVNFLEETTALFELTHSLFNRYVFSADRYLIAAVQTIEKKGLCDFDELKKCINRAQNVMDKRATIKEYMNNIEGVYNFKKKSRRIIF